MLRGRETKHYLLAPEPCSAPQTCAGFVIACCGLMALAAAAAAAAAAANQQTLKVSLKARSLFGQRRLTMLIGLVLSC